MSGPVARDRRHRSRGSAVTAALAYLPCASCDGRGRRYGEDECDRCTGDGRVRDTAAGSLRMPISPSAIDRVERRVAALLGLHGVEGANARARTCARALCMAPPPRDLAQRVGALCGVPAAIAASVVRSAVDGLIDHAVLYREDTAVRSLARRLESGLPTYEQRPGVLDDLRWP